MMVMLAPYWAGASGLDGVRCCEWRWGDSRGGNAVEQIALLGTRLLACVKPQLAFKSHAAGSFEERFKVLEGKLQFLMFNERG